VVRLRFRFILVLVLLFLFGCVQTTRKSPVSKGNVSSYSKIKHTSPPDKSEQVQSKNLRSTPSISSKYENPSNSQPGKNKVTKRSRRKIQATLDEALDFCQVSQDFWQKGELENALEALDKAYSLILKIDTYDSELMQQKEDLRFLISKRILEIYASRHIVVNGDHNAIPMVMNRYIQSEINLLARGREKKFFIESYKRSGKYRSFIVPALREAGLPVELSWLPLIESGFKVVKALSRARALGLWQFIPSTGYKFGLKRDKYIDERMDPVKATRAAISYLKELHQIFGDWTTVLAAYNCGEGKVLRVIRTQNINYLDNFWDLYERLPVETARYVPRFMATLHIVKNLEKYGLGSIPVDPPLEYETVTVSRQVRLKDIAKKIGVTENTLKELNPELRYKILPRDKYPLKVPLNKGRELLARLQEIPVSSVPRPAYVYHRVRSGETLSTIAQRYHTSVRRIARANNITKANYIVAGKKLKIPQRGTAVYASRQYDKSAYGRGGTHVVRKGDSLWILARRYGTTTKKIQTLNNLPTTNLSIGQVLKMPGRNDETPPKENLKTYLVKSGDSPFVIAQRHKMPLGRFLRINRLTPRSKIYPGQKLYVE